VDLHERHQRQSNNAAGNTLAVFCGLAEECVNLGFKQRVGLASSNGNATTASIFIGKNSTTAVSGLAGIFTTGVSGTTHNADVVEVAEFLDAPALGVNNVNAGEYANATFASTYYGGEDEMLLTAAWRG
jgi:hypothetical protein